MHHPSDCQDYSLSPSISHTTKRNKKQNKQSPLAATLTALLTTIALPALSVSPTVLAHRVSSVQTLGNSPTTPRPSQPLLVSSTTHASGPIRPLTHLSQMQHGNNASSISFSNSGLYLASTGGDRFIRIWHIDSVLAGDEDRLVPWAIAIPERDGYVTSMAFAPGDRYLVTGTYNGDVRIWDLHNCDPDPERYVCASSLWLEREYKGVAPVVRFSPNGQLLAASNYDGTVTIWNWEQQQVIAVLTAETGAHDGDQIHGRFSSLSFSPDGRYLAAGSHDTTVTVWTLEDFERVGTIETGHGVDSVAFSPDSQWLANGNLYGVELRSIRVSRGRLRVDESFQMEGNGRVNTLAFDPGGRFLFGGDNRNHVMTWDLEDGQALEPFPSPPSHDRPVLSIAMNPLRPMLASSSTDGVISLWRP